jgi:acetyl esterase/lipase
MKRIFIALTLMFAFALSASAQKTFVEIPCKADKIIKHWNNKKAPHSNEITKDEFRTKAGHIANVTQTVFYLYKADADKATGQAVVILPGGGYRNVCIEREGFAIAEYFKSIGVTALVVKYRLPNLGHKEVPLEDAQAGLAYLRKNAKKLGVDPTKVGICGSSAGGHLAAYTSTFTEDAKKPAFSILFYPVISGESCMTHQGTFLNLLGKDHSPAMREQYSLENQVTATTPPTLLLLSNNDGTVPPISSVLYYEALKHHGVEASMHNYPEGGHGWVFRKGFHYEKAWQDTLCDWLKHLNRKKK